MSNLCFLQPIPTSLTTKIYYYDLLYNIASDLFATYNPCRFNSQGKCVVNRMGSKAISAWGRSHHSGCCENCKYLSPKGCLTNSIGCKLYVCFDIERKFPAFCKEIERLKEVLWDYDLPWNLWRSKEDWIKNEMPRMR